jgi:hypothetical protein
MSIVSSIIVSDSPQRDSRRWIHEVHTDQLGIAYDFFTLIAAIADAVAMLNARAAWKTQDLIDSEIASNLANITTFGKLATFSLKYSTQAQNAAAIRAAYLAATAGSPSGGMVAMLIGDFLYGFTDAQLAVAFGVATATITNTIRPNNLLPARTAADVMRAQVGV